LFWDFLREGRLNLADKNMQLRNTALGWIVTGDTGTRKSKATCNVILKALREEVDKFWNVEECPSNKILSYIILR
jgi:hypothetical protein